MNEPVVYADLTFLINFIMDFCILWATGKLVRVKLSYLRLIVAAIFGGLYAVGFLFLNLFWYSLPMKLIFSFLIVILGLRPQSLKELFNLILYFYGISFFVAGATIATAFFYNTNQYYFTFSYLWLLGGVFATLLLGYYGEKYLEKKIIPSLLKYEVKLNFAGLFCEGAGFLDTGNSLIDPLTNKPVLVAEYKLIKKCLPEDVRMALENSSSEDEMLSRLTESSWSSRLRLIPFTSIGKRNGLLIGIRADEVIVNTIKNFIVHKNLTVAIYLDRLSHEDDYQMLIPSKIIQTS